MVPLCRCAAGTNSTACALLRNRGMAVSDSTLNAVSRWGAWSNRKGVETIVSTYESVALDEHVNSFGLAYGLCMEADVWERRLRDFEGRVIHPQSPVFERGVAVLPWDLRIMAMQHADISTARATCNSDCLNLFAEAEGNRSVNPVRRYREARELLLAHRKQHAGRPTACMLQATASCQRLKDVINSHIMAAVMRHRDCVVQCMAGHGYRYRCYNPKALDEFGVAMTLHSDGARLFVDKANGAIGLVTSIDDLLALTGRSWTGLWVQI